jgi:anti-anti-sigma regulatory factor
MSENAEPYRAQLLKIEARHDGAETTVILDGELDIRTVERFLASIQDALEVQRDRWRSTPAVSRSWTRPAWRPSSMPALQQVRRAGVRFRISEASPKVRRIAEVAGVTELLLDD